MHLINVFVLLNGLSKTCLSRLLPLCIYVLYITLPIQLSKLMKTMKMMRLCIIDAMYCIRKLLIDQC